MPSYPTIFAALSALCVSLSPSAVAQTVQPGAEGKPLPPVATERAKTLLNDVDILKQESGEDSSDAKMKPLYDKFQKLLTGAKLTGLFTVDGKPMDKLTPETYEIESAEKQPGGDTWIIKARIKYGKNDRVFPCPVEVKWAGRTPVITLDDMTIPGMGTFGARVVFHKDKYAGTWQHDEVGGHMFGRIEFATEDEPGEDQQE